VVAWKWGRGLGHKGTEVSVLGVISAFIMHHGQFYQTVHCKYVQCTVTHSELNKIFKNWKGKKTHVSGLIHICTCRTDTTINHATSEGIKHLLFSLLFQCLWNFCHVKNNSKSSYRPQESLEVPESPIQSQKHFHQHLHPQG
jgi:hypothetical protein